MTQLSKEEFFQRYDIDIRDGRLGGGAFGTVYKAWDNLKDEWKAIKIAEVKIINGKEFSLISEFDATKRLPIHKNIINYESVHTFAMPNGMFDYAVMQYYPHGNLKQLAKSEKLNEQHKIELIIGLFRGLEVLHSNGVKHRDLKPSNILISERKGHFTPKIADFGLAKYTNDGDLSAVTNSFGGGTLEYSSPEQLLGEPVRDNTDIWAVGVMAYELFVGHIPFIANNDSSRPEVRRRTISQNIVNAAIPPEIQQCPQPYRDIITKCLIKDPALRIKTAKEVLAIIGNKPPIASSENNEVVYSESDGDEETVIISVTDQLKSNLDKNLDKEEENRLQNELKQVEEAKLKEEQERLIEIAQKEESKKLAALAAKELKDEEVEKANRVMKELERKRVEQEAKIQEKKLKQQKAKEQAERQILEEADKKRKKEKDRKENIERENRLKKNREDKEKKRKEEKKRRVDALKQRNASNAKSDEIANLQKAKIENEVNSTSAEKKLKVESNTKNRKWMPIVVILFFVLSFGGYKAVQYSNTEESLSNNPVDIDTLTVAQSIEIDSNALWNLVYKASSLEQLEELSESNHFIKDDERYRQKEIKLLKAIDEVAWNIATNKNSIESYSRYIDNHPNGDFLELANQKMKALLDSQYVSSDNSEREMYEKAVESRQIAQLQYFIDKYPDGDYLSKARSKIAQLKEDQKIRDWKQAQTINTLSSYQSILKKYPNTTISQQANQAIKSLFDKEMKAKWEEVKSSNDIAILKAYEKRYPNSKYSNLIKSRITLLNNERSKKEYQNSVDSILIKGDIEQLEVLLENPNNYKRTQIESRILELKKNEKSMDSENISNTESEKENTVFTVIANNMIRINGGSFSLGCTDDCNTDNTPAVITEVSSFYLSKYEVTQEEYEAVMGSNPSTYDDCKKCPVENVNYYDAEKYIHKLNGLQGTNYRLPTEKEWEYAAKAGKDFEYSGGNDIIKVGVYKSNSNNGTQQRGSKRKNAFGIYDMTGNVHEWCNSQYTEKGYGENAKTSNQKVIRGGSWRSKSSDCKIVNRGKSAGSVRNSWTGFRLASD